MHADQHEYSQIMVWSHLAQNLYLNQLQASLRRACLFSNFEKRQALRSDACINFKVWDEIFQRQFPNFNGKWISNFVHYFKWHIFASTSWCPALIVITINQGNNFFFRSLKLQWFTLSILIWSCFECFEESIRCRYLRFFFQHCTNVHYITFCSRMTYMLIQIFFSGRNLKWEFQILGLSTVGNPIDRADT